MTYLQQPPRRPPEPAGSRHHPATALWKQRSTPPRHFRPEPQQLPQPEPHTRAAAASLTSSVEIPFRPRLPSSSDYRRNICTSARVHNVGVSLASSADPYE